MTTARELPVWRSLIDCGHVDKYVDKAHTRGADVISSTSRPACRCEKAKARSSSKQRQKVRRAGADVVVRINAAVARSARSRHSICRMSMRCLHQGRQRSHIRCSTNS